MVGLGINAYRPKISADGSTIVGNLGDHLGPVFRWSVSEGLDDLGKPEGAAQARVIDVSASGEVIAVNAWGEDSRFQRPILWTPAWGFQDLGPLPDGWRSAVPVQISENGSFLLGSVDPEIGRRFPFLWSEQSGFQPLPIPEDASNYQTSMTGDASIVVGTYDIGGSPLNRVPFVWDARHGTRELTQVLAEDHGIDATFFQRVLNISADGTTLIVGTNQGPVQVWAIYLDKPLVDFAPGDYNRDGLIDAADYTVWRDTLGSTSSRAADGNSDGAIDEADYLIWKESFSGAAVSLNGGSDAGAANVPEAGTGVLAIWTIFLGAVSRGWARVRRIRTA